MVEEPAKSRETRGMCFFPIEHRAWARHLGVHQVNDLSQWLDPFLRPWCLEIPSRLKLFIIAMEIGPLIENLWWFTYQTFSKVAIFQFATLKKQTVFCQWSLHAFRRAQIMGFSPVPIHVMSRNRARVEASQGWYWTSGGTFILWIFHGINYCMWLPGGSFVFLLPPVGATWLGFDKPKVPCCQSFLL